MENNLILWKDIRLFIGVNERPALTHKHPIIQLIVARDEKFKTKLLESQEWQYEKGLLIKPNTKHQCDASNIPIVSLEIDSDTTLGEWILNNVIEGESYLEYPSKKYEEVNFGRIDSALKNESWDELYAHIRKIFRFDKETQLTEKDERIENVVSFIHANINKTLSTDQMINVAFLSESRLLHLFKEQMGLPIRNYILWYRLKVATEKVINGDSLTTAAHAAGFSDQSHFTRSCVNMIGVPPSTITKNSKFVQVYFSS